jgi:hypothetical protein
MKEEIEHLRSKCKKEIKKFDKASTRSQLILSAEGKK